MMIGWQFIGPSISRWLVLLGIAVMFALVGCGGGKVSDPAQVLGDPGQSPARHQAAVGIAQAQLGAKETERLLRRMIAAPGYALESREMAWDALMRLDREGLARQLEIDLPRLVMPLWRARICELIVEETWIEMTPTLIRAWARPSPGFDGDPEDRPERKALIAMYGEDQLSKVLVQVMLDADPIVAANLRARCWELLMAEGRRDTVVELLASAEVDEKDGLFRDLRTITNLTGVVPVNREEILWARALCAPENREFLDEIAVVVESLPESRRQEVLEMRDLGVLVGASRLDPELLKLDATELASRLSAKIDTPNRRVYARDLTGYRGRHSERLREVLDQLDWGDLLAITVAAEALQIKPVRSHLFDHAERDLLDKGTEYGGIISIDDQGRFVVLEFPPRRRNGDSRFEASQAMFDAGYSGLFHFHHHAQKYDNKESAGPHQGDFLYALANRANCLVFTFIDSRTLNADWYRHGGVVVDLGVLRRPD